MLGSRDTNFRPFLAKIGFLGTDFSRTVMCTANPMVVGCVQHYSTNFVKKLGKSLESFFRKVKKNCKKWGKMAKNADFSQKRSKICISGTKHRAKTASNIFWGSFEPEK